MRCCRPAERAPIMMAPRAIYFKLEDLSLKLYPKAFRRVWPCAIMALYYLRFSRQPAGKVAFMSGNPTVASVVAQDLAGYGARRCFGLLGTANFKISHGLVEAGVELISARHEGNAAGHGRRLCQGERRAHAGQRAFRPGLDQCADRHRRSREKPDAAAGAGGRCPPRSSEEQFLYRAGRDGACRRRGVGAAAYARLRARRHAARRHPRFARPADCGA